MKVSTFFLILLFSSIVCSKPSKNAINLSWMTENLHHIEKTVSSEASYELIPVINTLSDIWYHRDGATTAEVSIPIIKALIFHPKLMLPMLTEKPDSFERWLDQFSGIVFTDFSGKSFDELKILHQKLTNSMADFSKNCESKLLPYAEKILEKLATTPIRSID